MKPAILLLLAAAAAGCQMTGSARPAEEAASAPAQPAVKPVPKELPAILARVNGESIERWEVETAVREIESMTNHPIISSQRDALIRNVLDRIIAHHLMAQEARAQKLLISDGAVEADVARLRKEFPDQQSFEDKLAEFGTSLDQLLRQTRLSMEVAQFVRTKMPPSAVPTGEIEGYYREHLDRYQEPETVGASHILIRVFPDSTLKQHAEARARAEGILEALRRGADFEEVARQLSQDDSTAPDGGSLGRFQRGSMDKTFEAVAFSMKAGDLSDVVETPFGYHVIKTTEHQAARTAPLDEVKGEIEQLLIDEAQQAKMTAFVTQAKAKAKIEIYI